MVLLLLFTVGNKLLSLFLSFAFKLALFTVFFRFEHAKGVFFMLFCCIEYMWGRAVMLGLKSLCLESTIFSFLP